MIKIAHESPIDIFEQVQKCTDIDYALVHLFEDNPEYYNLFKKAVKNYREVILDNSLFELGTAFDAENFAKWVSVLEPTIYVVPDVWMDAEGTIESFDRFNTKYAPGLKGLKMGVVQGRTYEDYKKCYQYMDKYADYIAISFDHEYFQITGSGATREERAMNGRIRLLWNLYEDNIFNERKPHHLLGCSLPYEINAFNNSQFQLKKAFPFHAIRSWDTSNPVVAGYEGIRYTPYYGLRYKPTLKLHTIINEKINGEQLDTILYNIKMFKVINNV